MSKLTEKDLMALSETDLLVLQWQLKWRKQARPNQIPPLGDWSVWMLLAGRGFGKTRVGAEWIGEQAQTTPNTRWAVIAPTSSDVRDTCFEGDSGLVNVIPEKLVKAYNRSLTEMVLVNGSRIKGFSSQEPERLRGPQFHGGWCCLAGTKILMRDGAHKNIEEIAVGDMVATRYGPRKVTASGVSHNPNCVVSMKAGSFSLTMTTDHPIMTDNGFKEAGLVKVGDKVCRASLLSELAGNSASQDTTTTVNLGTTTALSMSKRMENYLKNTWFTTLTTMLRTTASKTSQPCLSQNTSGTTGQVAPHQTSRSSRLQKHLKHLKKHISVCVTGARRALFQHQPASPALFAVTNAVMPGVATDLNPPCDHVTNASNIILRNGQIQGTARTNAVTTQQNFASNVFLEYVTVSQIDVLPNCTTYNLTVEGEHEYIANGFVVHNCDELAAWEYPEETWDMYQFGLRLGVHPRTIITTTPKPIPLVRRFFDESKQPRSSIILTTGSTYDNKDNLAPNFFKQIARYEGTQLGRQEIYAEMIDPEEAGIIKRSWLQMWPADVALPRLEYVVQSYDTAFTDKTENDMTVCTTWGVFQIRSTGDFGVLLLDAWGDRLPYPDLREKAQIEFNSLYGEQARAVDCVLIEDKGSGITLRQDLERAGIPVRPYNPGRSDKLQRLHAVSYLFLNKRIFIPESKKNLGRFRTWAEPMINQLCAFPMVLNDDWVDSVTQAVSLLRDLSWLNIDSYEEDEYYTSKSSSLNPYAI